MDATEEPLSQYLIDLLMAIGYSKTEVYMKHLKWYLLNLTANSLQQFNTDILRNHYSGSASEGLTGGIYYSGEKSDHDLVQVLKKVNAITDATPRSVNWTDGDVFEVHIETDTNYPGYVKLPIYSANRDYRDMFVYCSGVPYLQNWLIPLETYLLQRFNPQKNFPLSKPNPHGPAMSFKASCSESVAKEVSKMIGTSPKDLKETMMYDLDFVGSIHAKLWPDRAKNWIVRQNKSGWLTGNVIDQILSTGCLLVPVGHVDSSQKEILWRVSFNPAEQILTQQLNQVQLGCYSLLKIILKDFINDVEDDLLSSYFMKMTVFWFCEMTDKSEMVATNFISCIKKCLILLRSWLQSNHMPNYFIEDQNMFSSKFTEKRNSNVIDAINTVLSDPLSVLNLKSFALARKVSVNDQRQFGILLIRSVLNSWIELRLGLWENLHFVGKNEDLWKAYSGFDTNESIRRYKMVMKDLSKEKGYLSPLINLVENILGMLLYAKHIKEGRGNSTLKQETETFLTGTNMVDVAHIPLRRATFLIMEGRYRRALHIAESVLQSHDIIEVRDQFLEYLYRHIQTFTNWNVRVQDEQQLNAHFTDITLLLKSTQQQYDMVYSRTYCADRKYVINIPQTTLRHLCFDVCFMVAEIDSLPRPIQFELLHSDPSALPNLKIHPIIYCQFIQIQCYLGMSCPKDCSSCLKELEHTVKGTECQYQKTGYNLLAYCYGQQGRQREAARCLVSSLQLNCTRNNVAFSYFNQICNALLDTPCK